MVSDTSSVSVNARRRRTSSTPAVVRPPRISETTLAGPRRAVPKVRTSESPEPGGPIGSSKVLDLTLDSDDEYHSGRARGSSSGSGSILAGGGRLVKPQPQPTPAPGSGPTKRAKLQPKFWVEVPPLTHHQRRSFKLSNQVKLTATDKGKGKEMTEVVELSSSTAESDINNDGPHGGWATSDSDSDQQIQTQLTKKPKVAPSPSVASLTSSTESTPPPKGLNFSASFKDADVLEIESSDDQPETDDEDMLNESEYNFSPPPTPILQLSSDPESSEDEDDDDDDDEGEDDQFQDSAATLAAMAQSNLPDYVDYNAQQETNEAALRQLVQEAMAGKSSILAWVAHCERG